MRACHHQPADLWNNGPCSEIRNSLAVASNSRAPGCRYFVGDVAPRLALHFTGVRQDNSSPRREGRPWNRSTGSLFRLVAGRGFLSQAGPLCWAVKNPGLTPLFDCASFVPPFFLSPRASLPGTSERFGVSSGCDDDGPPRLACPTGRRSFAGETWLPARQAGQGSDGVYDCVLIPNRAFLPDKPARGRKENRTFSPQKIIGQYQVFNGPG